MQRTNIYLDEEQAQSLDEAARAQGISRAALIRRLIDRGLSLNGSDIEADLAAIEGSFGVLSLSLGEDMPARGVDERARHLDDVRRRL